MAKQKSDLRKTLDELDSRIDRVRAVLDALWRATETVQLSEGADALFTIAKDETLAANKILERAFQVLKAATKEAA